MDRIYTPNQVWPNIDFKKLPLEISIIDIKTINNKKSKAIVKNLSYTSEILENNQKVRANLKLYYKDTDDILKFPTLLLFEDFYNPIDEDIVLEFVEAGYMIAVFDYKGEIENIKNSYTIYPEELKYCNFNQKNKELYVADPDIFNTSIYHYVVIARRAIELLKEEPMCDSDNIAAIGLMNGCDIAWPTIAFDENIKTAILISNLGFKNQTEISLNITEENKTAYEAFQIACSAEAYSKINKKPVLSIIGTNNSITPIENVSKAFNLANENNSISLLIANGDNSYIDKQVNKTIQFWLNNFLNNKTQKIYKSPEITSTKIDENNVLISAILDSKEDILDAKIMISTIDSFAETRNWYEKEYSIELNESNIELIQGYGVRYCFLTIDYKNGFSVSSKPIKIITENKEDKEPKKTRIIYNSKVDKNIFSVKSLSLFSETSSLIKQKGPSNVFGVGTEEEKSTLITYAIGDLFKTAKDNYSLRFYAYTQIDKEVTVIVKALQDNKLIDYTTKLNIYSTGDWNAFIIDAQDLKDKYLKPLKSWSQAKILGFKNAENILFNNFIWI